MPDSTRKWRPRKDAGRPTKPYPDFPLTPHPSSAWQIKDAPSALEVVLTNPPFGGKETKNIQGFDYPTSTTEAL